MNMMEAICARKSVRSYTGDPVTEDQLTVILKAANAAPVGMGQYDAVYLTVITNPELLAKIDAAGAAMFGKPDIHPIYNAPMLVVVSAKRPAPHMTNVSYSNAAIIVQNMALAATELGIGACHIWGAAMAIDMDSELVKELNIPEDFMVCCAITLGQTDDRYEAREIPSDRISCNIIK